MLHIFFNRYFVRNIYCRRTTLFYSQIVDYTKFSITNLQWHPAANNNSEKCYKTFVHFCS